MTDKLDQTQEDLTLPADTEIEKALLGCIMIEPSLIHQAMELLTETDFYYKSHRLVFRALSRLAKKGGLIDDLLVIAELEDSGDLPSIGGLAYVASMITGQMKCHNLSGYAARILEKSQLREIARAGQRIAANAIDNEGQSGTELLLNSRNLIDQVATRTENKGFTNCLELGRQYLDVIEQMVASPKKVLGVPSGFTELDRLTCGFQKGQLIIIAARPGVGKSALALNIAQNAAAAGFKSGFFSLEMSKFELMGRMLCSLGKVDSYRLKHGYSDKEEWARLSRALQTISGWQIMIDDSSGNIPLIRSKARRLKAEHGLDILFLDYIQRVRPTEKGSSREQEVAEFSRSLKELAQELDIPIIALSQINRSSEIGDHKPQLWQLRESGALEADADVVLLIHREEMYSASEDNMGKAEIIIAKQRSGPTDSVMLAYIRHLTLFEDLWK